MLVSQTQISEEERSTHSSSPQAMSYTHHPDRKVKHPKLQIQTHTHFTRSRAHPAKHSTLDTSAACQEVSSFTCPPSPTHLTQCMRRHGDSLPAPRRRGNIPVIAPRSAVCIGSHPSVLTGTSLDLPS